MDPGSLPPPIIAQPDLAQLRTQIDAALAAYPELRRELRQALAGIDRRLGQEPARATRDRRRVDGLS